MSVITPPTPPPPNRGDSAVYVLKKDNYETSATATYATETDTLEMSQWIYSRALAVLVLRCVALSGLA
jgi:hypothetical protein